MLCISLLKLGGLFSVAVLDCLHVGIFHYYQATCSTTRASTVDKVFVSLPTDNFFQNRFGWHSNMNDSICWYVRSTVDWGTLAGKSYVRLLSRCLLSFLTVATMTNLVTWEDRVNILWNYMHFLWIETLVQKLYENLGTPGQPVKREQESQWSMARPVAVLLPTCSFVFPCPTSLVDQSLGLPKIPLGQHLDSKVMQDGCSWLSGFLSACFLMKKIPLCLYIYLTKQEGCLPHQVTCKQSDVPGTTENPSRLPIQNSCFWATYCHLGEGS